MNPTDIRQQYPEPQGREQKIALLRKHPPRLRQAGVHAPSRLRGSGEIIIRSHDPNPSAKDYDEGDRTLPRGILNTGDIELLQIHKELYADTLRTMPDGHLYVEYLDQRIAGLNRVKQQKEESRKKTERGELPVLPPVEESPDGTIKLTGVRQTEFQTATQGCWSVSLANILNSRGVQLSQKDIRAFRPAVSFESGNNLRAYETNEMNNDAGSDPYHDSELVMDNLPNTAVRHWGFENLPPAEIDEHGNVFRDHTDDTAVKAIREQVEYALKHDHSPIALKYCGHYQTIVGIKGNKLILKDSLPGSAYSDDRGVQHAPDPDASYEIDLYDIVRMTRSLPEDYFRDLSLMWLSELHKDPETGKVEELKDYPDLKVDEDGKLSLTRAENKNMLTVVGMADTECGGSAPQEKAGLRPFYKTKFPNVIHENLLKNSTEPSKTINEHLTIPNAALSPETRNHKVIGKLPGYETAIDPSLFTSEDDDLNRAILASLETAKQEQLRIQKNIGQRQANKMGAPVSTTGSISNTAEAKDLSADNLQGTGDSPTQDGQEQRGMDLLNDAQFEYIRNPEELNELAEIFRTKKSVRIVNWNSSEYNDAKSALDDFMTEHQKISEYIRTHYGKPGFNKGVEQQIANLNEKEENRMCRIHRTWQEPPDRLCPKGNKRRKDCSRQQERDRYDAGGRIRKARRRQRASGLYRRRRKRIRDSSGRQTERCESEFRSDHRQRRPAVYRTGDGNHPARGETDGEGAPAPGLRQTGQTL